MHRFLFEIFRQINYYIENSFEKRCFHEIFAKKKKKKNVKLDYMYSSKFRESNIFTKEITKKLI